MPDSEPPAPRHWSTEGIAPGDLTDAWSATLAEHYGPWEVHQPVVDGFRAGVRQRAFDDLRVVDCVCDPCGGRRPPHWIARDEQECIGVQITQAGRERFRLGREAVEIGAGDLLVWSSRQPAEFAVVERLRKVSLILPLAAVQARWPRGARFDGALIDGRRGIGAVLYRHIASLAETMDEVGVGDQPAVRRATLELLAAAMTHRVEAPPRGLADRHLRRAQEHVLAHLPDEGLSPTSIATALHLSPRYLHLLFARTGVSVSAWIKAQRLTRCADDLRSRAHRDSSVAEIAYAWGFGDAAHFSRAFKQRYGVAPRTWRERRPAAPVPSTDEA